MCPDENGTAEDVEQLPDELLRQAVDAVVDVVLRLDSEGRIRAASGDTLSMLGYRPGDLGGAPVVALYPDEGIETADGFRATLLDTDTRGLTLPVERADGTVRTVSVSVVSGPDGPVCLLTARGGPADRGGADPLDDLPDPAFVLDSDGRFTRVNKALLSQTGCERATVVGTDCGEILPGCPDTPAVDVPVAFETPLPDGTTVEGRLTPLPGVDTEFAGAVGVLLMEHRGLDTLKTSAERLLDNGRHELVCGEPAETRTDGVALPALAEWTRLADRPVEVDLGATVEAAAERVRNAHPGATVAVETTAATAEAHPAIGQAIAELLRNGIEHAPADGHVGLTVEAENGPLVLVEDRAGGLPDAGVSLLRADTVGNPEDVGGVGLWLVRLLAEQSDADLVVHRTGEGTVIGLQFGEGDLPAPVRRSRGDIVDREDPLATLDGVYDSATTPTREHGRAVLLTGEAGIGKTTVVEAFRAALGRRERPPLVATGRCRAGLRRPYDAFEQVFADLPTDRGVAAVLDDAAAFPADDAEARQQYRQTAFADVAARLCAVADDRPVVVVVEDLQWALDSTLDLFEFLVDDIGHRGRPVVLLGTCRTNEAPVDRLREGVTDADRGTVLELGPLDEVATAELLADFGVETPPERVHTHTGGNPLFVTELARLPGGVGADTALAETVEATIRARLDAVPESVRPTLELGAVAGGEFGFEMLRAASESTTGALVDSVDTLARLGVWNRSTETVGFAHETVREQTLDAVDPARRRVLHDRVASVVETVGDPDTCAGRLASHHEQAGNNAQAFEWYVRAGEHASEQYAHGDAVAAYERAVELAREAAVDEQTLAQTHADLADVLVVTGANKAAVTAYERAVRLAREQGATAERLAGMYADLADVRLVTGAITEAVETVEQGLAVAPEDSPVACRLLDVRTRLLRTRGEFEAARETASEQRDRAATLDARALEAKAYNHLGDIALRRSRHDRARDHYEQCLRRQRDIDEPASEGDTLNSLGVLAIIRGEYDIAREHLEESLELYRRIDDHAGESDALNNLGLLAVERGAYDRARRYYEDALGINRAIDARRGEAVCLNSLGNLEAERGAYDDAGTCLAESLTIHRELGDRHGEARTLHSLGDVAVERGAYDRAREYYRQSLDIRPKIDDRRGEAVCLSGLGRVAVAEGNHDRARESLEEALAITRDIDAVKPEITSQRWLGHLARREGEYDRAAEHLQASLSACEAGGDPRDRAETHLEQVRLALAHDRPDAARQTLDRARDLLAGLEATHADARATLLAGDIAAATGDSDEARTRWQAALDTFEQVDAPQDTLAALERLAEAEEDRDRAAAWHDRARTVAADAPDPVRQAYRGFLDSSGF